MVPRVLGVIPARGGSKRLPGKNIRPLAGHPMIAHTIMAAQKSRLLTDFIVSTDDAEIMAVAVRYDALTPFYRPAALAEDAVSSSAVVLHALEFMEQAEGKPYDIVMLLHPTSPIRDSAHIDEAIDALLNSNLDTLASVKGPYKKSYPVVKRMINGTLETFHPEEPLDKPESFYLYNASIYAAKRNYCLTHQKLVSERQVPLVMDKFHSVDVDDEADFVMAEACFNFLKKDSIKV